VTDADRIHYGITEALREARPFDHATVRVIASQLHGGQRSPLYALASSGAVVEGLRAELDGWRTDDTPVEVEPWLDAMDEYIGSRVDKPGPIEGWSGLWPSDPPIDQSELGQPDTDNEQRPPSGTVACAIGRTAISVSIGNQSDEDVETEVDDFPWTDAATWSPAEIARDDFEEARYSSDELDALFGLTPDEEIGSVDELGWYGLIRHEGRPGGFFLRCDEQGLRRAGEAQTDEALEALWAMIQQEYATFYEQRDAYEQATAEPSSMPSGHNPRVWVGSLADYNNGHLYGAWMDATLEPDELQAAVQFMLRNSDTPGAEEWSIMDHDDFGGYEVSEWSSFATVSCIAQGIAEHGEAYAAWVNYVGDTSGDLLEPERFREHYLGEWDSLSDYVEDVLQETGFYGSLDEVLERLPEDLQHYVTVDVEGIAEEWGQTLHVAEAPGGKVWVFDTRT